MGHELNMDYQKLNESFTENIKLSSIMISFSLGFFSDTKNNN